MVGLVADSVPDDLIGYRHVDPSYPFLWEGPGQPESRWNRSGGGPVHCFADTPDGAWAEFLRHEEIKDPDDLQGIARSLWVVELGESPNVVPALDLATLTGNRATYRDCQDEADAIQTRGEAGLVAPSAALLPGAAHGWRVDGGLREGDQRDGMVMVLFGARPNLVGWRAAAVGRPDPGVLARVRHF
jgi:hypothetical protein